MDLEQARAVGNGGHCSMPFCRECFLVNPWYLCFGVWFRGRRWICLDVELEDKFQQSLCSYRSDDARQAPQRVLNPGSKGPIVYQGPRTVAALRKLGTSSDLMFNFNSVCDYGSALTVWVIGEVNPTRPFTKT